jgi:hypothetical protein
LKNSELVGCVSKYKNSLMSLDTSKYFHPPGIAELCAIAYT